MTKTHKIYMPFNWKRTKKLTFALILINTTVLFLTFNSHGIILEDVQTKSHLKGFFAKHELRSVIKSSSWLPKISFMILQLDKKSGRKPTQIDWEFSSEKFSGLVLSKSWMQYKAESQQALIAYIILPGKSLNISVNFEEVAHTTLQLPQLYLEEGEQEHMQHYKIRMDSRYEKINISTKIHKHAVSTEGSTFKDFEVSVTTGQPSPKLSWKFKQILRTIQFMG